MRLDELKKGFWGYRKDSVYRYVVWLEEEAAKKLAQKDTQAEEESAKYRQQVAALEKELELVRKENAELHREQLMITTTLVEAQKYSKELREQTERQEKEYVKGLKAAADKQMEELDSYGEKIRNLKEMFRVLLSEFTEKAEEAEAEVERLKEKAPAANMVFFPKSSQTRREESETWKKSSSM